MATRIYSQGQLKRRVQFQRREDTRNGLNEKVGTWVNDGLPVWAAVEPVLATEQTGAGSRQGRLRAVVVVRYSAARTAERISEEGLRLVWKGRPLDIQGAVAVDGGLEFIELDVIGGVRDGKA